MKINITSESEFDQVLSELQDLENRKEAYLQAGIEPERAIHLAIIETFSTQEGFDAAVSSVNTWQWHQENADRMN